MKMKLNERVGILILIVATFFWGSTFAFTKELTNVMSPLWLVAIRFSLTTILLFVMFFKHIMNVFRTSLKKELPKLLLLGMINFLAIITQTMSLTEISASNSGFIASFAVLLVPFLEFFFRKKPIHNNIKIAVIILFVGIYIMAYGFNLPERFVAGDFMALTCAVSFAFYIILMDLLVKKINPGAIMFFAFFLTAIISLPLAMVTESSLTVETLRNFDFSTYFNMGFLVILGTVVPYVFMGIGQRIVSVQKASLIYILEPLFAMFIAILFFREQPLLIKFVGAAIIIIAQIIGMRQPKHNRLKVAMAQNMEKPLNKIECYGIDAMSKKRQDCKVKQCS